MLEVELFDVSDALFVVGDDLDVVFGPGVFIGFGGEKHGDGSSLWLVVRDDSLGDNSIINKGCDWNLIFFCRYSYSSLL